MIWFDLKTFVRFQSFVTYRNLVWIIIIDNDDDIISFIEKTKGQLAANMSKKIQVKIIKQMQMARHKLTTVVTYYT